MLAFCGIESSQQCSSHIKYETLILMKKNSVWISIKIWTTIL